jgi:hypothetical protein
MYHKSRCKASALYSISNFDKKRGRLSRLSQFVRGKLSDRPRRDIKAMSNTNFLFFIFSHITVMVVMDAISAFSDHEFPQSFNESPDFKSGSRLDEKGAMPGSHPDNFEFSGATEDHGASHSILQGLDGGLDAALERIRGGGGHDKESYSEGVNHGDEAPSPHHPFEEKSARYFDDDASRGSSYGGESMDHKSWMSA